MPVSGQHTVGSKADIFTPTTPTTGLTEEQASIQDAMNEEVDKRMNRALDDLKVKYATQGGSQETSVKAPTGAAYRADEARKLRETKNRKIVQEAQSKEAAIQRRLKEEDEGSDDDDDEKDEDELEMLREMRLKELKKSHIEKMENKRKGHGSYTQIAEDEFLTNVTASTHCIVHFFHSDFERCKIMDHHLRNLAPKHLETRFMKIDAAKTPFFVDKLHIRVIPTVVVFKDGVATARLVGFDGITHGLPTGKEDEFKTSRLEAWLGKASAIHYDGLSLDELLLESSHDDPSQQMTIAAFRAKMLQDGAFDDDYDDFAIDDA